VYRSPSTASIVTSGRPRLAVMGETKKDTEFWRRNSLLVDQEGNERITLRMILGK